MYVSAAKFTRALPTALRTFVIAPLNLHWATTVLANATHTNTPKKKLAAGKTDWRSKISADPVFVFSTLFRRSWSNVIRFLGSARCKIPGAMSVSRSGLGRQRVRLTLFKLTVKFADEKAGKVLALCTRSYRLLFSLCGRAVGSHAKINNFNISTKHGPGPGSRVQRHVNGPRHKSLCEQRAFLPLSGRTKTHQISDAPLRCRTRPKGQRHPRTLLFFLLLRFGAKGCGASFRRSCVAAASLEKSYKTKT